MNSDNIAEKYAKYYHSKTTDAVLAGLVFAENVGYEGLILFSATFIFTITLANAGRF